MSRNVTVQPDFDLTMSDTDQPETDNEDGVALRRQARLRRAGAGGHVGAMVADPESAAVPAQLDLCHASDRDRRACAANPQLAAGDACRCADRLQRNQHRLQGAGSRTRQII